MAATQPVALCTLLLPSGKLCRGIAVRNQRHCRAHIRNHRFLERERAQEEALDRLGAKINRMELGDLLYELHGKLENLNRANNLIRYPEVAYLLVATIDRLLESNTCLQPEPNQLPFGFDLSDINRIKQVLASAPDSNR